MKIKRNIEFELETWFLRSHRKPLLLRGARQVGKTFSVRAFAEKAGLTLVEINFEKKPNARKAFDDDLSPEKILPQLEIIQKQQISEGNVLLFFDEIQECPNAIRALRYFYEEMPRMPVIAAGSLLEFVLGTFSFPVGRVEFLQMYPLTFREFLVSRGYEQIVPMLPNFCDVKPELPPAVAAIVSQELRTYFIVGGLPEALSVYLDTNSFLSVARVQDNLLAGYLDDIRKYAKGDLQLENTRSLLVNIFQHVGRQINYTQFGQGDDIRRTKKSVDLLCQALLLHKVRQASPGDLPLGASAHEKNFKLVFLDIGLGQRMIGREIEETLRVKDALSIFDGRVAEQFVGQELVAESGTASGAASGAASENGQLYYWARNVKSSSAEVDFLIVRGGKAYPIEVKAGKSGSLKSLQLFLKAYGGEGIVLQDTHGSQTHENMAFRPIYTKL